jgi:hypothetical protein
MPNWAFNWGFITDKRLMICSTDIVWDFLQDLIQQLGLSTNPLEQGLHLC